MAKETFLVEPFNKITGREQQREVTVDHTWVGDRCIVMITDNMNTNVALNPLEAKRLGVMLFGIGEELLKAGPPEPHQFKPGDLVRMVMVDYRGTIRPMQGYFNEKGQEDYRAGLWKVSRTLARREGMVNLIQSRGARASAFEAKNLVFVAHGPR